MVHYITRRQVKSTAIHDCLTHVRDKIYVKQLGYEVKGGRSRKELSEIFFPFGRYHPFLVLYLKNSRSIQSWNDLVCYIVVNFLVLKSCISCHRSMLLPNSSISMLTKPYFFKIICQLTDEKEDNYKPNKTEK